MILLYENADDCVIVDTKHLLYNALGFLDLDNVDPYEGRLEFLAYLIDHSHADDPTQVIILLYTLLIKPIIWYTFLYIKH